MQELYDNLMLKAHGVHNETNSLDLMKTAEVTNTSFPRIRSAPNAQQHATDGLNQDRSDAISATKLLLGLNLARLNALSDEEKTTKAIKSAPTFSTSSSNINTFIPSSSHPFLEINSSMAAKQAPKYQHKFNERKRRKVVGNLDNTLDGLVAKKANISTPLKKRYQTEIEAIELPDDDAEVKRMEEDPDVSTRMCSVCGYQGKWVSEMIRHKRVHINDRPFKCKYCNRTSKWKADLIRHVAKTHGIRVVSKYSRSKAFEAKSIEKGTRMENDRIDSGLTRPNCKNIRKSQPQRFGIPPKNSTVLLEQQKAIQKQLTIEAKPREDLNNNNTTFESKAFHAMPPTFRCIICFFEKESFPMMVEHLFSVHKKSPFYCSECDKTFFDVKSATDHYNSHFGQVKVAKCCSSISLKLNFTMMNNQSYQSSPNQHTFFSELNRKEFPSMVLSNGQTTLASQSPTLSPTHSATDSLRSVSPLEICTEQTGEVRASDDESETVDSLSNEVKTTLLENKKKVVMSSATNFHHIPPDLSSISPTVDHNPNNAERFQMNMFPSSNLYGISRLHPQHPSMLRNNLAFLLLQSRLAALAGANASPLQQSAFEQQQNHRGFPFVFTQPFFSAFYPALMQQQFPMLAAGLSPNSTLTDLYSSFLKMPNRVGGNEHM